MVTGFSNHCLIEKFTALKRDLRVWKKEGFGNVSFTNHKPFLMFNSRTLRRENVLFLLRW